MKCYLHIIKQRHIKKTDVRYYRYDLPCIYYDLHYKINLHIHNYADLSYY